MELGGWDRGPVQAHFCGVQTAHPERRPAQGQAGHFPPVLVQRLFLLSRNYERPWNRGVFTPVLELFILS